MRVNAQDILWPLEYWSLTSLTETQIRIII